MTLLVMGGPAESKLPEGSTVDLSVIPIQACGVWATNVAHALESEHPLTALQIWILANPQDAPLLQVTYDYIMASDIRESTNFFGTANSDCLVADRGTEGSI